MQQSEEGGAPPPAPAVGGPTGMGSNKKLKPTKITSDDICPLPYPEGLNLKPEKKVPDGTARSEVLGRLKQLPNDLLKAGVLFFNPKTAHPGSFTENFKTMEKKRPIIYIVFRGDLDNPIILSDENTDSFKIGSTTNGHRRFEETYSKEGKVGYVIIDWDKLDATELAIIDKCVKDCYKLASSKFVGGFSKWIKTASVQDCHEWEKGDGGGLSIFFVLWLHQLIVDGGKTKRSVVKSLHLRLLEMGFQLHYDVMKGAQFEQLHYDCWEYILDNHDGVHKSAINLYSKIKDHLDGVPPRIRHHSNSVSWEPNLGGLNSKQAMGRKFRNLEGKEIWNMTVEDIENAVSHHSENEEDTEVEDDENEEDTEEEDDPDPCLNYFFERLTVDKLRGIKDVRGLVECMFSLVDNKHEMNLINETTELFYDFFWDVRGSILEKLWRNIYGEERPSSDDGYNPENLNHENARQDHQTTIADLKVKVDECKEDGSVLFATLDRTKSAYQGRNDLHLNITNQHGFDDIWRFGDYATAYVYKSKTHKCLGLLLVHHAVSKAFTSRPPYANQGHVRSQASVKDNSMAAVTALLIHAIMTPLREGEETNEFQPTDMFLGNPVIAYAMIMYLLKRWHLWDSQVAVMFGKDVLRPGTEQLDSKYGFEQKFPNKNARGQRSGFTESDRIALLLSFAEGDGSTEEKVKDAFNLLTKGKRKKTDGTVKYIERDMSQLNNALVEEGHLFQKLRRKLTQFEMESQNNIQQQNEERERMLEEARRDARNAMLAQMAENNKKS